MGERVVEGVELLRERERVLATTDSSSVRNRLVDDFVEPRRLEDQPPQLVGIVTPPAIASGRGRGSAASTPAASIPSRSFSFAKMLFARTTAYCRYGPLLASKLSASSMSNAITLPRENFTMK
jgi:hypothetical protein